MLDLLQQRPAQLLRGKPVVRGDGRRHALSHHRKLGAVIGTTDNWRWIVWKDAWHRRQVADVAVDHPKQVNDRGIIQLAHGAEARPPCKPLRSSRDGNPSLARPYERQKSSTDPAPARYSAPRRTPRGAINQIVGKESQDRR